MQGDRGVIQQLNRQLTNELSAINQYFLHARMWKHWGFERMAKHEYKESIEEMKHADKLIERILMLDGIPNLQDLHKLRIGETLPEGLSLDLTLERDSHVVLIEAIGVCERAADYVSREILREILEDTEEHIEFLETQLKLIDDVGLQNYLQSQMGGGDPN
jgi:bacterioferritin